MTTIFSKELLELVHKNVFQEDTEMCGNLQLVQESQQYTKFYAFPDINRGARDNGRGICSQLNKFSSPYLFHTHPVNHYAYPSVEDLWTCVKFRGPPYNGFFFSFLFTKWGLFIINPKGNPIDETQEARLKRHYYNSIIEFHRLTKESDHVSVDYSERVFQLIDQVYIPAVEQTFLNLTLFFIPWSVIARYIHERGELII